MRTVFIECEYFLTKDKHRAVLEDMKHEAGDDVHIVLLAPGMHVAEPAQQWIPVSERLPEAEGRYIITCSRNGAWKVDWNIWRNNPKPGWLWEEGVTAWMPLPEPYREENQCLNH